MIFRDLVTYLENVMYVVTLQITEVCFFQLFLVGLERGPLSLMSTTEELLDRKVAAPV
jgi:hypothetical protein